MPTCLIFLLLEGPVSYQALKGCITEYLHDCEPLVSIFSFEDTGSTTSRAAAETIGSNVKQIESCLDDELDALSEKFQNLLHTLFKKETETKTLP